MKTTLTWSLATLDEAVSNARGITTYKPSTELKTILKIVGAEDDSYFEPFLAIQTKVRKTHSVSGVW